MPAHGWRPGRSTASRQQTTSMAQERSKSIPSEAVDALLLAIEHLREVIWLFDADANRFIYLSPALEGLIPCDRAHLSENPTLFLDLVHPDDRDYVFSVWPRQYSGTCDFEYRLKGADGTVKWVRSQTFPLRDATGRASRVAGITTDITETRREAAGLRAQSNSLLNAIGQAPGILWAVDRDLRFTLSQGTGLAELGLVPDQVIGVSLYEFFETHAEDHQQIAAHREALRGVGKAYESSFAGRDFHTQIVPLREGADIVGAIGLALDITDRARSERALSNARDALEVRVHERTAELRQSNSDLEAANAALLKEIADRRLIEERLKAANDALRESERLARDAADSNRLLLRELDHRVRNNVAGLLGLVGVLRRRAGDVPAFADAVEGRLMATAHIHKLLAETNWQSVNLRTLAESLCGALRDLMRNPGNPVYFEGPTVELPSNLALPLTMVLVEWFTNSSKYGAHSTPGGSVLLKWRVAPSAEGGPSAPIVHLTWQESGGPRIDVAPLPSLGSDLVRSFVTLELRGQCHLRYPAEGAWHEVSFRLG